MGNSQILVQYAFQIAHAARSCSGAEYSSPPPWHRRWLPWGLSLVLGLIVVASWVHARWQALLPAVIRAHPFWSRLFAKNEPALIVTPDSGLVLYHAMSATDIDLKEYLQGGYRSESKGLPQTGPTAPQQDWLLDPANRRYTSMVDLDAILSLRDRARTLGSDVCPLYPRPEAAMDFLDDDAQLLPFLNQIQRPDGTIPYFELLIETRTMHASAVQSHIVAWRTGK
jgi:hypothetical protein